MQLGRITAAGIITAAMKQRRAIKRILSSVSFSLLPALRELRFASGKDFVLVIFQFEDGGWLARPSRMRSLPNCSLAVVAIRGSLNNG